MLQKCSDRKLLKQLHEVTCQNGATIRPGVPCSQLSAETSLAVSCSPCESTLGWAAVGFASLGQGTAICQTWLGLMKHQNLLWVNEPCQRTAGSHETVQSSHARPKIHKTDTAIYSWLWLHRTGAAVSRARDDLPRFYSDKNFLSTHGDFCCGLLSKYAQRNCVDFRNSEKSFCIIL